jgi:hypothetical protein
MRLILQFFSCIFRHFKNALTGEHGRTRLREIMHMKGLHVYFDRKKIQLPKSSGLVANCIWNTTITQPCNATIMQPCNATITQHCNATITQPCNATSQRNNDKTLQGNNHATLQCNNHATLQKTELWCCCWFVRSGKTELTRG